MEIVSNNASLIYIESFFIIINEEWMDSETG